MPQGGQTGNPSRSRRSAEAHLPHRWAPGVALLKSSGPADVNRGRWSGPGDEHARGVLGPPSGPRSDLDGWVAGVAELGPNDRADGHRIGPGLFESQSPTRPGPAVVEHSGRPGVLGDHEINPSIEVEITRCAAAAFAG